MSVRILEDRVVDRIAAGEVVERPASVVKELVENALDAGAHRLHIRLKQGGVGLVQVTDDGSGMSREDAMLCIERHATSKIRTSDDLVGVLTHGFRGEALPSIASVARLELRTRTAEDEVGTEVVVDGGTLEGVRPVACAVGTDIAVRSLFSHTPARRKFLKGAQVELEHALEAVRRAVLRRPDVDVLVAHEGRELLRAPKTDDAAVRVRDVLGADAGVLLPVDDLRGVVRVEGLIAPPGVHRGSATGAMYVYVNGRFVRDPVLRRAIGDAYRGAIPPGRFPVLVIGIEVPGEDVDVNVHPQKTEVRFSDPKAVADAVGGALRDALRSRVAPRVAPTPSAPPARQDLPLLVGLTAPKRSVPAHPDDDPRLRAAPRVEDDGVSGVWTSVGSDPAPVQPDPRDWPEERVVVDEEGPLTEDPTPLIPTVSPPEAPPVAWPEEPPLAADGDRFRDLSLLGVHGGHIAVCSSAAGLVLVDLERVRRVDLAATLTDRSRPLLVPAAVTLPRAEAAVVVRAADALSAVGVEVTALGPGRIGVVALPEEVPVEAAPAVLQAVVAGRTAAEAVAGVIPLAPVTAHQARGLLARLDEAPELATGAVARLDDAAVRALLRRGS